MSEYFFKLNLKKKWSSHWKCSPRILQKCWLYFEKIINHEFKKFIVCVRKCSSCIWEKNVHKQKSIFTKKITRNPKGNWKRTGWKKKGRNKRNHLPNPSWWAGPVHPPIIMYAARVCRNRNGTYLGSSAITFSGVTEASIPESLAVLEAQALPKDLMVKCLLIASDCQAVVKDMSERSGGTNCVIVKEIVARATEFEYC